MVSESSRTRHQQKKSVNLDADTRMTGKPPSSTIPTSKQIGVKKQDK